MKSNKMDSELQATAAPGNLEVVRTFLNTVRIPNDTRLPLDLLKEVTLKGNWSELFPNFSFPNLDSLEHLICLRDELRVSMLQRDNGFKSLTRLLREAKLQATVHHNGGQFKLTFTDEAAELDEFIMAAVAESLVEGTWGRLKVCPDCGWVFFDSSKNQSKIWCRMTSGGTKARGCGAIAKVRTYREKQKAETSP